MSSKKKGHIVHKFDEELAALHDRLLDMGALVEAQMQKMLKVLKNLDSKLAEKICAEDSKVDEMEVKIDAQCALLIATRQPAARDMRTIMATLRCIYDLERVGDEITKIARCIIAVSEESEMPKGASQVTSLSKDVAGMFSQALKGVSESDIGAALEIASKDKDIDQHCNNVMLTLAKSMEQQPKTIASCINFLWIVRSLERIGDHACNLTEHVVYSERGKDVRHKYSISDLEKSIKN